MFNFKKIYLSGGMTGLEMNEQKKWRDYVISYIKRSANAPTEIFNPPTYYNFEEKNHDSEREVFEYDLTMLRKSDLIIVNFNNPNSIGTAMELAVAKEYNIPVVGLNIENNKLHPWLIECCTRIFSDIEEMLDYVLVFYII